MKSIVFLLLLSAIFSNSYAQIVKLTPQNPAPRLEDRISIRYTIEPWDASKKSDQFSSQVKLSKKLRGRKTCSSSLSRGYVPVDNFINDTGMVEIGPFIFNINGKEYKSDVVSFYVSPKLPNVRKGFWIRYTNYRGERYITIKKRRRPGPRFYRGSNPAFAELNDSLLKSNNLKITGRSKSSGQDKIEGELEESEKSFYHQTAVYKFSFEKDSMETDFQLLKEHFINFPEDSDFKPLKIKNLKNNMVSINQ